MTGLYVAVALIGFMGFLAMQPKVKVLVALILTMNFFDLAPGMLFGMYVWDFGAILMLVAAVELYVRTPVLEAPKHAYLMVLKVFLVWATICFLWSILVYRYPLMHTIKSARQVLVGYLMTLIFIRLFRVQPGSFEYLLRWLYWLTFVAMPVVVMQYVLQKPLMFGLINDFDGVIRIVPVFLAESLDNQRKDTVVGEIGRARMGLRGACADNHRT
jgi:hypothetical protein